MGVFSVPVKIHNWQNQFLPKDQQGAEVECEVHVDSGAAELALPTEMIDQLRLQQVGTVMPSRRTAHSMSIVSMASPN